MNKKKSIWMKIAVTYCVVVCFFVSVMYYHNKFGISLAMISYSIKSVLSAFTLGPGLDLDDVVELGEALTQGGILPSAVQTSAVSSFVINMYAVACTLAPICTLSAMIIGVEMFIRKQLFRRHGVKPGMTVIFGYSEVIGNLCKEEKNIVIVSANNPDVSVMREMNRRKIYFFTIDMMEKDSIEELRKCHLESASKILIMEKDDFTNLTIYMKLMESGISFQPNCYIKAECKEPLTAELFKSYYNEKKCMPIALFKNQELAAEAMMREYPVEEYLPIDPIIDENGKESVPDTHILITGFGKTGQIVLDRILNEAIVSADSRVFIDVLDKNESRFREEFLARLSGEYGTVTDNSFALEQPDMDGYLYVQYTKMELTATAMDEYLKGCSHGFDYAVLCLADAQTGINTALKINNFVRKKNLKPFPILVLQETHTETSKYLNDNCEQYGNIHYVGALGGIESIFRTEDEERAKAFHNIYQNVKITVPQEYDPNNVESSGEDWNTASYFKQVASRKSENHLRVKEYVLRKKYGDRYLEMIAERYGENGTILKHVGDGYTYLMDEDTDRMVKKMNADELTAEMAKLEHRRWCVDRAVDGWSYAEVKNEAKKETRYLRDWDTLCEESPWVCIYDINSLLYIEQRETTRNS